MPHWCDAQCHNRELLETGSFASSPHVWASHRISVEQTRSITEGLVAKLEEQAADATDGDGGDPEEPAENGDEEEEDEEDSEEERPSVTTTTGRFGALSFDEDSD